ncbi:MAG: cobalt-precorrin-6A reductase [Pseudomonadota bacterium]
MPQRATNTAKILILGGTKEAAALAHELVEIHGTTNVITSLAGRTREPKTVSGTVRIGGFGGAAGLAEYITRNDVTMVVDATHPFAEQISSHAKRACEITQIPLDVRTRPPWKKSAQDIWIEVTSLADAKDQIPQNARVLLALGSQHISQFADRDDVFFLIRMIDEPTTAIPFERYKLIVGPPPKTAGEERCLLREERISHIVCRNSGGASAYAKIEAARALRIPVIIVQRTAAS